MSYDLMFQKAIDLQNSGALNEAESIYLQILQAMPENSDVWNLLGLIAQSRGDNLRAMDCFLSAIKYAPMPFFAHFFNLGLVYNSLNKRTEAIEMLQKAANLQPDSKEIWNYLGLIQAESGAIEEAVKSFCKALEVDEHYEDARANLCFYTKDIDALLKLAEDTPHNFWVNYKAAESIEDFERKESFLLQAVADAPERTEGLLALAQLYLQYRSFHKSLMYYHKVLNLDENNVQALLGVADVYLVQKEYDNAERYYLRSFSQNREIAGAHLNYGIVLYQTGRLAEALEEYRKAAALNPDTPEISYNLALILKETGDLEEALGLMFNAHLKAPNNQDFIINISETLAILFNQNAELALKIAENWQKLEPENLFSKRLLAGMSGETAEDDVLYSKELFNSFAATYDQTMVKLEPQIISKFKEIYGDIKGHVLDLGCGTGWGAASLKNENCIFDGVDISESMLAIARQKEIYNNLFQQDILSFLQTRSPTPTYNLALAFDVFCYMGALDGVLAALNGLEVWFSVESADEERGKDYYLTPSGRYKHSSHYIQRALKLAGYEDIIAYPLVLRKENGEDVKGVLFGAR